MFHSKEDVDVALEWVDMAFANSLEYPVFRIVGASALLCQGFRGLCTEDIDIVDALPPSIFDKIESVGVDLNDAAAEYRHVYEDAEFEHYGDFSNIEVLVMDVGDVIASKVKNLDDEDKMENLAEAFEKTWGIQIDAAEIATKLSLEHDVEIGIELDEDLENWCDTYNDLAT